MLEMNQKRGATLVLVTHDHELAAEATRSISLRDGRVVSDSDREAEFEETQEETVEVSSSLKFIFRWRGERCAHLGAGCSFSFSA